MTKPNKPWAAACAGSVRMAIVRCLIRSLFKPCTSHHRARRTCESASRPTSALTCWYRARAFSLLSDSAAGVAARQTPQIKTVENMMGLPASDRSPERLCRNCHLKVASPTIVVNQVENGLVVVAHAKHFEKD